MCQHNFSQYEWYEEYLFFIFNFYVMIDDDNLNYFKAQYITGNVN